MIKAFCTLILLTFSPSLWASPSLIDQADKLSKNTVSIKTIYLRTIKTADKERVATYTRTGVGIILDPSGIIVTNTHTIVHAPRIIVTMSDGRQYQAQVGFVSNGRDFAFLKIDPDKPLPAIRWGNSANVQIGDSVLTIGAAGIDTGSILLGKITGLIQNTNSGQIEMLETDLKLYKGDSGTPLIDSTGKFIGMIMAKSKHEERVSMAIAADIIRREFINYQRSQ